MRGITLVEVLTVVAVMAVLLHLLYCLVRVRESGRRSACQSNLKQIALAVQQYVQDNDGRFPSLIYGWDQDTPTPKA
jgi:prepilin-type N-terminal cleavage/methylation domain-containing protein